MQRCMLKLWRSMPSWARRVSRFPCVLSRHSSPVTGAQRDCQQHHDQGGRLQVGCTQEGRDEEHPHSCCHHPLACKLLQVWPVGAGATCQWVFTRVYKGECHFLLQWGSLVACSRSCWVKTYAQHNSQTILSNDNDDGKTKWAWASLSWPVFSHTFSCPDCKGDNTLTSSGKALLILGKRRMINDEPWVKI